MPPIRSIFFRPHIERLEIPCERLPHAFDGLSILHLSDLHITRWTHRLAAWRRMLGKVSPDAVVITGDLGHRAWLWNKSLANVQRLLEPLAPPLGTFFILGNHDSAKLGPALALTTDAGGHPRTLLRNQSVFVTATAKGFAIKLPDAVRADAAFSAHDPEIPRLALIGIHQHRRIDTDIPSALRGVHPSDFKLMLLHYPDLIHPAVAAGADICLAGHTHGGQICWPDGSPIFRHDTLDAEQTSGVHRINGSWMIVNRGIGMAGVRMRLFCPPEAILLTLRAPALKPL